MMCLLTAMLLTVSFAPYDCWFLAYVALVPWTLGVGAAVSRRAALLWGTLAGTFFWAINLYWLWWVTLPGYFAAVVYLSAYWFVAAMLTRAAVKRNWPTWIVLPVIWVALEYARAYVVSGFPWFYMAHSQYARTPLIQIADLTGQYGVSFFVVMVNGMLVDLLDAPLFIRARRGARLSLRSVVAVLTTLLVAAGMLIYGYWRMNQKTTSPGPVVAVIQRRFPIRLAAGGTPPEVTFASHLASSQRLAKDLESNGGRCHLLVWPETMLPRGMNAEVLRVDVPRLSDSELRVLAGKFYTPSVVKRLTTQALRKELTYLLGGGRLPDGSTYSGRTQYAAYMGELSSRMKCPILAGGTSLHRNAAAEDPSDRWVARNSALWFDCSDYTKAVYSKIHLVPFSEYVPFQQSWPGLYRTMRWFVPSVMEQLDPGVSITRFTVQANERKYRLAAPICYEGTFARICRDMVVNKGEKSVDILVNLSNDGWFVWPWGTPRCSAEHSQHLVHYCFRAVENRVPVVRAVNTGISASVDSCGRIVADIGCKDYELSAGTLLLDGATEAGGKYADGHGPEVLVDSRVSVYSQIGDWFALAVGLAGVGMAAGIMIKRRRAVQEGNAK